MLQNPHEVGGHGMSCFNQTFIWRFVLLKFTHGLFSSQPGHMDKCGNYLLPCTVSIFWKCLMEPFWVLLVKLHYLHDCAYVAKENSPLSRINFPLYQIRTN